MLKHFSHTVASFCRFGRQAKHSSEMKVVLRCLGIYLNSVNFIQKTSDYLQKLKNLSNTLSNLLQIYSVTMSLTGIARISQCKTAHANNSSGRSTSGASGRLR